VIRHETGVRSYGPRPATAAGRTDGEGGLMIAEDAESDRPFTRQFSVGYIIVVIVSSMALPVALATTCYWLLTRSP
jgi:hypothetical protein